MIKWMFSAALLVATMVSAPYTAIAGTSFDSSHLMGGPISNAIEHFEQRGVTGPFGRDDVWTEDVEVMYVAVLQGLPDGEAEFYLMGTPQEELNLFAIHWTTKAEDFRFGKINRVGNALIERVFGSRIAEDFLDSKLYVHKSFKAHSSNYYKGRMLAYSTSRHAEHSMQTFSVMPHSNLDRNIEIEESHQ